MVEYGSAAASAGEPQDGHAEPAAADAQATSRPAPVEAVTGEPRVDAVIARIGELADAPLDEHTAVFERIHDGLREVLAELDAGAPGASGQRAAAPGPPR